MANFVIQEVGTGKALKGNNAKPIRLELTVTGKSMPFRPWKFGVTQRTIRTDYPGSTTPTEQILGWNFDEFSLEGRLDDKYNTPGFAAETQKTMELLVQRGNPVSMTWTNWTVSGVITNIEFDVRREWDIGYKITFSPHTRAKDPATAQDKSSGRKSASNMQKEINEQYEAMDDLAKAAPLGSILGTRVGDVVDQLNDMKRQVEEIAFAIETGNFGDPLSAGINILTIAGMFSKVATIGGNITGLLSDAKSSDDLSYLTDAQKTLDFDYWAKQTAWVARQATFFGITNATAVKKLESPDAKRIYRPQVGESMYGISNKFYGTPHNWRIIAERNKISDFILTGDEILVIPDAVTK